MIQEKEYKERRNSLVKSLAKHSVTVLFSALNKVRSHDTNYPYRQDSNFYYMTGFKEDNSILMLVKKNKSYKSILFINKKDKVDEIWNGKRLGIKKAKKRFLVDEIYTKDDFEKIFKDSLIDKKSLYFDFGLDYSKVKVLKRYTKSILTHHNIAQLIGYMRLLKSDAEIRLIKKALSITKEAHHKVMKMDKVSKNEYQLQATIEHTFKNNGSYSDAYPSIVASGNNANTLHYIENNKNLKDGDLILVDAGCEYDYYASDITRTIPVNKKFSSAQKDIYELVLHVEKEIISMIKPGVLRSDLHKKSEELLVIGMKKLNIMHGRVQKILKQQKYKLYYPHGIGHWMGLDVHDASPYKDSKNKEIPLQKGMVLTIEPALYFDKKDKNIPKKYRGIGVRIEDNILVTNTSNENLSIGIIKEVYDIQKFT